VDDASKIVISDQPDGKDGEIEHNENVSDPKSTDETKTDTTKAKHSKGALALKIFKGICIGIGVALIVAGILGMILCAGPLSLCIFFSILSAGVLILTMVAARRQPQAAATPENTQKKTEKEEKNKESLQPDPKIIENKDDIRTNFTGEVTNFDDSIPSVTASTQNSNIDNIEQNKQRQQIEQESITQEQAKRED
jgi:multisubunit Na+/H+ antiporter MnhC subunit